MEVLYYGTTLWCAKNMKKTNHSWISVECLLDKSDHSLSIGDCLSTKKWSRLVYSSLTKINAAIILKTQRNRKSWLRNKLEAAYSSFFYRRIATYYYYYYFFFLWKAAIYPTEKNCPSDLFSGARNFHEFLKCSMTYEFWEALKLIHGLKEIA